MSFNQETATNRAKQDMAGRLNLDENAISVVSVNEKDFPDMSLGAPVEGEMSAQMISSGWEIVLGAAGHKYNYRADKYQLRLVNEKGSNHIIVS
ncbi:MAG: hypothetical protein KDB79_02210 [Acidobacteria bacterium]|nr:hypothetical protein [Acidobacteriota bacterium]